MVGAIRFIVVASFLALVAADGSEYEQGAPVTLYANKVPGAAPCLRGATIFSAVSAAHTGCCERRSPAERDG